MVSLDMIVSHRSTKGLNNSYLKESESNRKKIDKLLPQWIFKKIKTLIKLITLSSAGTHRPCVLFSPSNSRSWRIFFFPCRMWEAFSFKGSLFWHSLNDSRWFLQFRLARSLEMIASSSFLLTNAKVDFL